MFFAFLFCLKKKLLAALVGIAQIPSFSSHLLDRIGVIQLGRELRQQRAVLQGVGRLPSEKLDVRINFLLQAHADVQEVNALVLQHMANGGGGQLLEPLRVESRSEERRVGKECRSRWTPY